MDADVIMQPYVELNGGEYPVFSATIDLAVDSMMSLSVDTDLTKTSDGVRFPSGKETLKTIGQLQAKRLLGISEPDMKISIKDGYGNTAAFDGYATNPGFSSTKATSGHHLGILPLVGHLDAIDMSIYDWNFETVENSGAATLKLPSLAAIATGDFAGALAELTQRLLKDFSYVNDKVNKDEGMHELAQITDTNNQRPIEDLWMAILRYSSVQFDEWEKACKANPGVADSITEHMSNCIRTPAGGFWSTVQQLCAMFQTMYIPEIDGVGFLVRADSVVGKATRTHQRCPMSVSVSDGSRRVSPLGGVAMIAPPGEAVSDEYAGRGSLAARYPEKFTPGFVQRIPPPIWLIGVNQTLLAIPELEAPTKQFDLDLLACKTFNKKVIRESQAASEKAQVSLMTELCHIEFNRSQLANSTAGLSFPLDLSIVPGYVTEFPLEDGGKITGFVSGVSHRVATSKQSIDASTTVSLTHVQF